jgi:N-glycosylase/DNA lyase
MEKELRECRLGFRAKSLLGAANVIASGEIDLGSLANKPTGEARKQLCLLPGVGRKVANCVLLFAFL